MKPRITLLTLGVDDLERAVRFYRDGLGWKTEGIVGAQFENGGGGGCFRVGGGVRGGRGVAGPRASLAHDSGLKPGGRSATELSIGHNVASKQEVDDAMNRAKRAGAAIVKPAHDTRSEEQT